MNYQLELKQLVDYPRCRIYREFIHSLIKDKNIRTSGGSYLFYYLILCSYANYRRSYRRIEGITYTVEAGEWICSVKDLQNEFRFRFQHQVLSLLNYFEEQHYISYSLLGKSKLVKFTVLDWKSENTVLSYSYPCKKDTGFFFFPVKKVHELISMGKSSEMDVLLDLWIHTVYNDTHVQGSEVGPVVYIRNHTGSPLTSYSELAERWGRSKATTCRIIKKLEGLDYISVISFSGSHGSVIYLKNYLSTMFSLSDVLIDKEEVALSLSLTVQVPDDAETAPEPEISEQIVVSDPIDGVPKTHINFIIEKVANLLETQALPCCRCRKAKYQLSKLSDCRGLYRFQIICPFGDRTYQFELRIRTNEPHTPPALFRQTQTIELKGGNSHV